MGVESFLLKRVVKKASEEDNGRGFGFKFSVKQFFFFLVSIVLLYYVFRYVGFENMFEELDKLKLAYLIPVIVLSLGVILIDSLKNKLLTDQLDKTIKYSQLVPVYLVGMLFNALTPGAKNGGEFVKSYYLTRISNKISYYQGIAISLVASLIFHLTFGPLAVISLIGILIFANVKASLAAFLFLLLLVMLLLGVIVLALHKHRHAVAENPVLDAGFKVNYWLTKRRMFESYSLYKSAAMLKFGKFVDAWGHYTEKRTLLAKGMALQCLALLCEFLKVYILFASFKYPISFLTVVVIVSVARLAGYLLILPGGVGVTEASLLSLYYLFGVAPGVAAAVTIIDRASYYLINSYGGGLVGWGWLSYKYHVKPAIKKVVKKKQ